MHTTREIEQNIFDLAEQFKRHMRKKEYAKAKNCYNTALTVSLFVGLEEDKKLELFGSRDPEIEGMFREKDIQKAVYECDIRRKAEEAAVWDDAQRRYGGFTH